MSNACGCSRHLSRHRFSRRNVLKVGVAGAGLVALGPMTKLATPAYGSPRENHKRLVVVNAFGGNDTTNVLCPTKLQPYYDRRGALAVQKADGISLNGGPKATNDWVMNPAMPKLAKMYKDGDVACVNKVGYPSPNLSHFESQEIFSRGVRDPHAPGIPSNGWIARYAERYAPTAMGCVSVGVGRMLDFIGGATDPLLVQDLRSFRLLADGGGDTTKGGDYLHRLDAAKKVLARFSGKGSTSEAKKALEQAHDLADQVQAAVANYSSNVEWTNATISRRMKDIATLVEGGFETRIFYTGRGGFDTHSAQGAGEGSHADRLREFDDAIGDFAQDMKDRGLWNDTVIIWMTEFGRRNFVNGSDGTDHGHGFCEFVIGGKVRGGVSGGEMTEEELNDERYLSASVDFRKIYKEVVADHLGGDADEVFPEPLEINDDLNIMR